MQLNTRSKHFSIQAHEKNYQSTQLLYQNRFKGKNEDKWHENWIKKIKGENEHEWQEAFIEERRYNTLEPTHVAALLLSAKEFQDCICH